MILQDLEFTFRGVHLSWFYAFLFLLSLPFGTGMALPRFGDLAVCHSFLILQGFAFGLRGDSGLTLSNTWTGAQAAAKTSGIDQMHFDYEMERNL